MIFVWLSFLTSLLVTLLTSLNFGPRRRRKFNRFIPNLFLLQSHSISTSFVLKVIGSTGGDWDSLEWASLKNRRMLPPSLSTYFTTLLVLAIHCSGFSIDVITISLIIPQCDLFDSCGSGKEIWYQVEIQRN